LTERLCHLPGNLLLSSGTTERRLSQGSETLWHDLRQPPARSSRACFIRSPMPCCALHSCTLQLAKCHAAADDCNTTTASWQRLWLQHSIRIAAHELPPHVKRASPRCLVITAQSTSASCFHIPLHVEVAATESVLQPIPRSLRASHSAGPRGQIIPIPLSMHAADNVAGSAHCGFHKCVTVTSFVHANLRCTLVQWMSCWLLLSCTTYKHCTCFQCHCSPRAGCCLRPVAPH
jgi:hypothetical protein